MTKARKRAPVIGPAFDPDTMNEPERIAAYIGELEYYRPRGFSKLAREGRKIISAMWRDAESERVDAWDSAASWMNAADDMLTAWARRVDGHEYITFGPFPHGGAIGFYVDAESATADADHVTDHRSRHGGDSDPPAGFRGLHVIISDHGNIDAYRVTARRCVHLFGVV